MLWGKISPFSFKTNFELPKQCFSCYLTKNDYTFSQQFQDFSERSIFSKVISGWNGHLKLPTRNATKTVFFGIFQNLQNSSFSEQRFNKVVAL